MSFELKDGQGSLFKNNRKTSDSHPNLTGEIKINGEVYWISGWTKPTKNGDKWISLSVKKKDDQRQTSTPAPKQSGGSGFDDFEDDLIPF
jgi:hypothetical protein